MTTKKIDIAYINTQMQSDVFKFVNKCEQNYKKQVKKVVDNVHLNDKIKFIFLAGPSGSGKTTTSKIMEKYLKQVGHSALALSLDDYFVERDQTPVWEDGEPNYETFDAIDWELFGSCMQKLLKSEPVKLPYYHFKKGQKFYGEPVTLNENAIVIIEGLHALNPIIEKYIPADNFVKVYISANTDVYLNGELLLEHYNVRFFRRSIRDMYSRATPISENAKMWNKVRIGEMLYIDPYKKSANFAINSFHGYELCVYKDIISKLKNQNKVYVGKILEVLKGLSQIDMSVVPADSVLQEFLPKHP